MEKKALLAAVAGAVVGALAWAAFTYFTESEHGYVAWGVGALIGGAAAKFGSRGTTAAMTCAGLALVAIFAGKFLGTHLVIDKSMKQLETIEVDPALFEEYRGDAEAYKQVTDDASLRTFLIERGYYDAEGPEGISTDQIAEFKRVHIPLLEPFLEGAPTHAEWSKTYTRVNERAIRSVIPSTMSLVFDSLSMIDLLFFALGIGTAFKLGEGLDSGSGSTGRRPRRVAGDAEQGDEGGPPPPPGSGPAAPVRRRPRR